MTTLQAFAAAIDICDPCLGDHGRRVFASASSIARVLEWDDARILDLELGAALHDVGKVNTPPGLLEKADRLDPEEVAAIRAHPVEGAWLIAGVRSLQPALPYVLFHHERWDGTGYPTRRAGKEIPLEGRVLAVADAFDAMTSARPYRRALTHDAALAEVQRCSGTQFDPDIVDAFLAGIESAGAESIAAA